MWYISDLHEKAICPTFSQFHFTSWSLATEEQNEGSPVSHDMDNDYAFDMNAVPEPLPVGENNVPVDNFEGELFIRLYHEYLVCHTY